MHRTVYIIYSSKQPFHMPEKMENSLWKMSLCPWLRDCHKDTWWSTRN